MSQRRGEEIEDDARPAVGPDRARDGSREHVLPQLFLIRGERVRLRAQASGIHLDRLRLDRLRIADDGHGARPGHLAPDRFVLRRETEERADDLREHRAEVRRRVLGVVHLRSEERLHDARMPRDRGRRHEDVDAEARDVRVPHRLREIRAREICVESELATDRLTDAQAVQRACEGIRDGVRDRAVVLVPRVERRDVVGLAAQDRSREPLDPLRSDAAQVRVNDRTCLRVERDRAFEDRVERRALARRSDVPSDRDRDVLRVLADAVARAVLRSAVRVDERDARVAEMLAQPACDRRGDMADRAGVAEARDADDDVGLADLRDPIT